MFSLGSAPNSVDSTSTLVHPGPPGVGPSALLPHPLLRKPTSLLVLSRNHILIPTSLLSGCGWLFGVDRLRVGRKCGYCLSFVAV